MESLANEKIGENKSESKERETNYLEQILSSLSKLNERIASMEDEHEHSFPKKGCCSSKSGGAGSVFLRPGNAGAAPTATIPPARAD